MLNINVSSFISKVDEFRYKQMLENLLNYITTFSAQGTVTLTLDCTTIGLDHYLITSITADNVLKEELKDLSDFDNIGNNYQLNLDGTGIGLSFCNEVIISHGGFIKQKSKESQSIIEFYIPKKCRNI